MTTHQLDVIAPVWDLKNPDSIFSYLGARELLKGVEWTHVSGEGRRIRGHDSIEIVSSTRRSEVLLENSFSEEIFAYAASLKPLAGATPRGVFCGEGKADLPLLLQLEKTFGPVLYLPGHPDHLDDIAIPGPQTLFTPRSPQFHGRALGSALFVVSRRLLPCLAARGSGIPTVWIAEGDEAKQIAEEWNLARVSPYDDLTAELKMQIVSQTQKFPHPEVFRKGKAALEEAVRHASKRLSAVANPTKRVFASISNLPYLPFLEGFIANLVDFYPGDSLCVYVLALDAEVGPKLLERMKGQCEIRLVELKDLWTPELMPEIHRRSIAVQAFSSKPLLLRRAVDETNDTVFYADSDVYFLSRPDKVWEQTASKGVLLFPHWNDTFECSRSDGLFNAGMVVASPKGLDFLNWWSERCGENANFGMNDGVVADQGYLDFGPALFDSVKSYRHGDHDVARWNLQSLGVYWDETYPPQPRVLNGDPVQTYHTAFVDSLSLFELKCGWDGLNLFFSPNFVPAQIPRPVFELALQQQAKHWLSLSRWLAIGSKFSWVPRYELVWLQRALSARGRRLLSLLAGGRKVEWNPAMPVLPVSTDPWIKANRHHFQFLNNDLKVTVPKAGAAS